MENNKNLLKMTKTAWIVAGALIVMLVISVVLSAVVRLPMKKDSITVEIGKKETLTLKAEEFFDVNKDVLEQIKFDTSKVDLKTVGNYEAYAKYDGKTYTIKVKVEDTTAPVVKRMERVAFTNGISKFDASTLLKGVEDASTYSAKLVRFEKTSVLKEMNALAVKNLEEKIALPGIEEELKKVGKTDVPKEQGIYRSVMEIKDAQGNASYEEVYVILDTDAAVVNEVEDMTIQVPSDKIKETPTVELLDKANFGGYDEVDGYLYPSDLSFSFEEMNKEKNEWKVTVSYTDRAGNTNATEFVLTLKEKAASTNTPSAGTGTQNPSSGTTGGNSGNAGNTGNTGNTGNSGSTGNGSTNSTPTYHPADKNKDGIVTNDEEHEWITPDKQACIDAGYNVPVSFNNGEYYMMLAHVSEVRTASWILRDYLAEKGLYGSVSGHSQIIDKDYYWFVARNIRPLEE